MAFTARQGDRIDEARPDGYAHAGPCTVEVPLRELEELRARPARCVCVVEECSRRHVPEDGIVVKAAEFKRLWNAQPTGRQARAIELVVRCARDVIGAATPQQQARALADLERALAR